MTETTHPTKRKTINVANSDNKNSPRNTLSKCAGLLQTHPKTTFSCINFIILMLAYWRFFNVHYSADTYVVYYLDDSSVNIINSRPLGFLAAKLNYLFNINQPNAEFGVTLFFLLVLAICAALLAYKYCRLFEISAASENRKRRNSDTEKERKLYSKNETKQLLHPETNIMQSNFFTCLTINLAVILIFTNTYFIDWMRFVECYTMIYAPAIALMTLAFLFTFKEKPITTKGKSGINKISSTHKIQPNHPNPNNNPVSLKPNLISSSCTLAAHISTGNWIKAGIMLLLASWFYQQALFIYLQLVLGALLISSTYNFRGAIKNAIICVLVVLIVGILSIIVSKLVFLAAIHFGVLAPDAKMRESISSLGDIKNNILFILSNMKTLLRDGCGVTIKYFFPACFFVTGICLLAALISAYDKKPRVIVTRLIVAFIFIAAILVLIFSSHLIAKSNDISARTLVGVYAALSSLLIATLCIKGTKKPVLAVCAAVILVALISNISLCNAGTKAELAINEQEHAYSDLVQQEIDEYERTTGNEITKIVRTSDAAPSKNMEDFGCEPFNTRSWNIAVYWTTVFMINIYENRTYEYEEMSAADKERLFGNVNYDAFDAEKQMIFEGNTLYLLVY